MPYTWEDLFFMKKYMVWLISALMAVSMTACSNTQKKDTKDQAQITTAAKETETTTEAAKTTSKKEEKNEKKKDKKKSQKKNMRSIQWYCHWQSAFWKRISSLLMANILRALRQQKNMPVKMIIICFRRQR